MLGGRPGCIGPMGAGKEGCSAPAVRNRDTGELQASSRRVPSDSELRGAEWRQGAGEGRAHRGGSGAGPCESGDSSRYGQQPERQRMDLGHSAEGGGLGGPVGALAEQVRGAAALV